MTAYLFCYFIGNRPEEERVHFALSRDGYNFKALNGNKEIFLQTKGKRCCRDPYIFRGEDGRYHIIATDMRSDDGWTNNNSMVVWDSENLTEWKNERIIDFSVFKSTESANRVWAPQVIFDREKGEYMIYWTHHNKDSHLDTIVWYAYSADLVTLTTEPQILYQPQSGLCAIDADIIEKDGKFYLYTADGKKDGICYCVADRPSGPYFEPCDNKVSVADTVLEGNCLYKLIGQEKYIMIADKFRSGGYFMQETTDMINFAAVEKDYFSLDHLRPRHGSIMHISEDEYNALVSEFGIEE